MAVVKMKVKKHKQGNETFWTAKCKNDGWEAVAESENKAVLTFFSDHLHKHPGCTVEKV